MCHTKLINLFCSQQFDDLRHHSPVAHSVLHQYWLHHYLRYRVRTSSCLPQTNPLYSLPAPSSVPAKRSHKKLDGVGPVDNRPPTD